LKNRLGRQLFAKELLAIYFDMRWKALSAVLAMLFLLNMATGDAHTAVTESWKQELLDWRVKHVAELQKPDGWLSLAGLEWLAAGDNSFGGAADNKIRLAGAQAAHLGVLQLKDDAVRLAEPAGGFPAGFLVGGAAATPQVLRTDADHDKQAVHMRVGTLNMYVIRRADRFALRVKDSNSQAMREFHGLRWFDPDAGYRVTAKWIPYNPVKKMTLLNMTGTSYEVPVPGAAEFELAGATYRLEPVQEEDPPKLFFILRDATSTSTTYGASRFLYTALPSGGVAQPGELLLDFNHLENPPCAYTPFATCPLPPAGNRLPIALPVGELRYHEQAGTER
jgi:uncharacterized protein (DUF1684 family)